MRFGVREFLFILLLVLVPVGAHLYVFNPRNTQISVAREEMQIKQQKLKELKKATQQFDSLGEEIRRIADAVEICEQKLPQEQEVEVILKEVWELASKYDLKPKSVRTDKPVRSALYSELPIKMVILGNFDGFYGFLLDLEQLRRITHMPEMKLKKTSEGVMEATVVLSIFFDARPSRPEGDEGKLS